MDYFFDPYKVLPTFCSLIGILLVYLIYVKNETKTQYIYRKYIFLPMLSCKKLFADSFYNFYINKILSFALNTSYKLIDQGLLEFFGSLGIYNYLKKL